MSLKYYLSENHLAQGTPNYTAHPAEIKSHDLESIIELMLGQGSTVTRADVLAVLDSFFATVAQITENGEAINTDLFKTGLSISGIFAGAGEPFDKSQHQLHVNINPGKTLKEALAQVKVERIDVPKSLPHILEVQDSSSGSINDIITPDGALVISGSLLKIEGQDSDNGVFFVANDGSKNKVATLVENKPARLIVMVPALAAGSYRLQVTSQYGSGSTSLKQPRTGVFDHLLTVA